MTHRLLTAGLLLAALAWCGRTAAKPPDLPLEDKDVLAPQAPLAPAEAVAPSSPTRSRKPPSQPHLRRKRRRSSRCGPRRGG